MLDVIRTFLESYGLWIPLLVILTKMLLGVIVAVDKKEFKWYYLDNILVSDALKFAALLVIATIFGQPEITLLLGTILVTSATGGIIKNLVHLFPEFGDVVPSSFREPARARLGNVKNLP